MRKAILIIAFILVFLLGAVAGILGVYFFVARQFLGGFLGGAAGAPGAALQVPTTNPFNEGGYQNPFSGVNPFAR